MMKFRLHNKGLRTINRNSVQHLKPCLLSSKWLVPIKVNEIFIAPNIEELTQNYQTLHDLLTAETNKAELSLENESSTDIPHLKQNLMSLLEFTPDKLIKLQKSNTFFKNILQHIHCSKNVNYFIDAIGILHKKVISTVHSQQWSYHKSLLNTYCMLHMIL